jgi:hypothetical protein
MAGSVEFQLINLELVEFTKVDLTKSHVASATFRIGSAEISAMAKVQFSRDRLTLSGLHLDGPGANTMGVRRLRQFAQWLMKQVDVDELRIEGATRTTGACPGRGPTPIVFRRNDNCRPAQDRST